MSRYQSILHPDYIRYQAFIDSLPVCFDQEGTIIYNSRNQVRLFVVGGETLVVKRYKIPMFHQRVAYTWFRPSKARRAYLFGLRLLEAGIDTPKPVACIEEYHCGLFRVGWFVSSYCPDANARSLRDDVHPDPNLLSAIAQCLVRMHEHGILHGDTNLSNFLYREDASETFGYHITTIDVNRSTFKESLSVDDCARNLCRLTHVRPLLQDLITCYASIRNWNADDLSARVFHYLSNFEKKRFFKRLKKRIFSNK